ncbi:MAG: SUMF1/EgtB/PvdO family nonheme iron enzyme [Deltaproteobacteria bacterium]|nr:SUMF1/EgtB/PvdO family nonheme iron enzyme [Deltaproteobacteria bacterium]
MIGYLDAIRLFSRRVGLKPKGGRVLRGGSWNNNPDNCRSAARNRNNPDNRNNNNGFRLVLHFHRLRANSCRARNPGVQGPLERGLESPGFGPAPFLMCIEAAESSLYRRMGSVGQKDSNIPSGRVYSTYLHKPGY